MSINYRVLFKVIGVTTTIIGISMLPPFVTALYYKENVVAAAFLKTMIPAIIVGLILYYTTKPSNDILRTRDGFLIVSACWLLISALGAVPYVISGVIPSFIDAFFESVSGFTTTGATILFGLTDIPKGLLFWRSFCHWLGGMGILVLLVSIMPALGISGQQIVQAEAPGPTLQKVTTRISDSSRILYSTYIGFTLLEAVLLHSAGLNTFDTLIHTFGGISTGGLSNYSNSIAHFNSVFVEVIILFFGILATINFILYNHLFRGRWREFLSDKELQIFLMILGITIVLITADLRLTGYYESIGQSLRYASFQTVAFICTSGFSTADYTLWPTFCQMLLFMLMFIGGCSASTAGGIKVIRIAIIYKLIIRGLYKRLHPNAVYPVKLGGKVISAETVSKITSFTFLYFLVFLISALVLSLDGHDLVTTLSAAAGALSNTGVGMGLLGPAGTYSIFSEPIRLYISFLMIAGRLELFTFILLLAPSFWDSDRY